MVGGSASGAGWPPAQAVGIGRLEGQGQRTGPTRLAGFFYNPCELAVNFQEVVHSARTGNADVAKPQ